MRSARILVAAVCLAVWPAVVVGQTGENVLVVVNSASHVSVDIANYYIKRRQIPADHLVTVTTSTADQISRAEYEATIQAPISAWLSRHAAQDRILYIVLTKGLPLRIAGTGGRAGTVSSVDSELTLLYRRMTGIVVAPHGAVPNPYYLGDAPVTKTERFSHARHDIYLVTRLDGFTADDAKALVDRAMSATTSGRILLDQRAGLNDKPNDWLAEAAKRLESQGLGERVLLEQSSRVIGPETGVLGYYSWGSNDPSMTDRHPGVEFAPGALASMFLSSDARTFAEPPTDWKPGRWESRQSYFAASPQSLTADLVRAGVTGATGYVAEPYLDSTVRPEILFPAYVAGLNLAEAFYAALPTLSWQSIVVGDPLCAPFTKSQVSAADLNPPLDRETELPAHFSARRTAAPDLKSDPAAAKLVARAEARLAKDNTEGAIEALEQAVKIDGEMVFAWRSLGGLYEQREEWPKAAAAYREVIKREPKDAIALNNLAYLLAVRENNPKEALPLAERAFLLAPRNAIIADTVGWIRHLLGDHAGAVKLLEQAAKVLPRSVDVQLHAAVVFAAAGRMQEASAALKAAEAVDPGVKERAEYQEVLKKVGKS
jgi:uncharacterized protein (TIGR03790 family)